MGKTKTQFVGDEAADKNTKNKKPKKKEKVGGVEIIEMEPTVQEVATEIKAKKAGKAKVRGKKYLEAKAKVDRSKLYGVTDAVALVKETSTSKFDGTVELHLLVKKEGLSVSVELPHSTGKSKKIEVASEDTLKKLESGKVDFDVLLSTAEMMPRLVPYARILGPKGLMPNPKNGTLIKSAKDAEKFNAAKLTIKTEKTAPVIHAVIGKVSMKPAELSDNVNAVLSAVNSRQIVKAYLTSTMGPSVKVAVA